VLIGQGFALFPERDADFAAAVAAEAAASFNEKVPMRKCETTEVENDLFAPENAFETILLVKKDRPSEPDGCTKKPPFKALFML